MFGISFATKVAGAGAAGLLLAGGAATAAPAGVTLLAARSSATQPAKPARPSSAATAARRAAARAVFLAEASVLGIKPEQLRDDIRMGTSVGDLARDEQIDKAAFAAKLATASKPGLDALVTAGTITQKQEDRILKAIGNGHVPFWTLAHGDVRIAIVDSEADVLHISSDQLREDIRQGTSVAALAGERGISKGNFAKAMAASLKPRLEQLVAGGHLTQARADQILDGIGKGRVPFWHLPGERAASPAPTPTTNPGTPTPSATA